VRFCRRFFSEDPFADLAAQTEWFVASLRKSLEGRAVVRSVASLFWVFFGEPGEVFPPEVPPAAHAAYASFFRKALEQGIYLPPSPYEVGFLSTAHSREVLEDALARLAKCVD
jgi:glutamate-1-semialdehyde 2,1-aminomutase